MERSRDLYDCNGDAECTGIKDLVMMNAALPSCGPTAGVLAARAQPCDEKNDVSVTCVSSTTQISVLAETDKVESSEVKTVMRRAESESDLAIEESKRNSDFEANYAEVCTFLLHFPF